MAHVTEIQRKRLLEMGRPPIELPAEIFFGGNEVLQKAPGRHHLPQYQNTGTYMHPNLVRHRLRVAEDRLKRSLEMKMSEAERRSIGGGDPVVLRANVAKYKKEWLDVIGKEMKMELQEKADEISEAVEPEDQIVFDEHVEKKIQRTMPVAEVSLLAELPNPIKLDTAGVTEPVMTIQEAKKKMHWKTKQRLEKEAAEKANATPDDPGEPDVVAKAQMAAMARPSDDLTSD